MSKDKKALSRQAALINELNGPEAGVNERILALQAQGCIKSS